MYSRAGRDLKEGYFLIYVFLSSGESYRKERVQTDRRLVQKCEHKMVGVWDKRSEGDQIEGDVDIVQGDIRVSMTVGSTLLPSYPHV